MDLHDTEHNAKDGLHIASLAGAWLAVVAGFGGMRDSHGAAAVPPAAAAGVGQRCGSGSDGAASDCMSTSTRGTSPTRCTVPSRSRSRTVRRTRSTTSRCGPANRSGANGRRCGPRRPARPSLPVASRKAIWVATSCAERGDRRRGCYAGDGTPASIRRLEVMRFGCSYRRAGDSTSPASTPRTSGDDARHRRRPPTPARGTSIWVYDHFHTVPVPTDEATHEAWTLMAALGGGDRAGPARPDVHLHGLPQPRLPRQGRRDVRRHLRRPGRDGHRRRLVRARVAGLRLRLPRRGRAARDARRGRADHAPGLDGGRRDARRQALPGRRRDLPAAAVAGRRHPAVDRRRRRDARRCGSRPSYAQLHELRRDARRRSGTSPTCWPSTVATSAATSTRSPGRPTSTSSSAPPSRTCRTSSPGCGAHYEPLRARGRRSTATMRNYRGRPARRHARTDRRAAAASAKPSA